MSRRDWECGFDAGVLQRDELRAQRDELLAALTEIADARHCEDSEALLTFIYGIVGRAIAKAEGQV